MRDPGVCACDRTVITQQEREAQAEEGSQEEQNDAAVMGPMAFMGTALIPPFGGRGANPHFERVEKTSIGLILTFRQISKVDGPHPDPTRGM